MNPYPWPATCSVCGGEGVTTSHGNYVAWRGGFLSHADPTVCAAILRQREGAAKKKAKVA